MTPQVTVLLAVRDGERTLGAAIDSVLSQMFSDLELLVVNDGSGDATSNLLAEYARQDSRVRILQQPARGLVSALNRGIAAARAPIIARLDADDIALPERIAHQMRYLDENPDVVLLGSWAVRIIEDGRPNGLLKPPIDHSAIVRALARDNPFIHSSVAYRTAAVQRLGGYRTAFEAAEDYDLWLRFSETGKVANLAEPLIHYRFHKASESWRNELRQAFSVRLAKRAAQFRRSTGQDPAEVLVDPPDWWAVKSHTAFFAEDSRIFQFLELSDAALASTADLSRIDLQAFVDRVPLLTHRERKLGQYALLNLLGRAGRPASLSSTKLVSLFIRLHPARAFVLGWRSVAANGYE
jgi:GT2 family glycosyltransferase